MTWRIIVGLRDRSSWVLLPHDLPQYRANRLQLLFLIADDGGVRAREIELLVVTVIPPDEIRWLPILMTNLEDGAVTSRLARAMSTDHDPVPNSCVHDVPNLFTAPPLFIVAVAPWLGAEVLDVPVVFVEARYGLSVERRSKESRAVLGGFWARTNAPNLGIRTLELDTLLATGRGITAHICGGLVS